MKMQFEMKTFPLPVVVISLLLSMGAPSKVQAIVPNCSCEMDMDRNWIGVRKHFNGLGKSYVLSERGFGTFGEARAFCQQLNGDLASNLNLNDFEVLDENLYDLMCNGCSPKPGIWWIWVGVERDGPYGSDKYKWITGESIPPNFERWDTSGVPTQPSGLSNAILSNWWTPKVHMRSQGSTMILAHALCNIH